MPTLVADHSSNAEENILHAAKVIGRSRFRQRVFEEVYRGKKSEKTVEELIGKTKFPHNRVLDAGRALADNNIVRQVGPHGSTAYQKVAFFQRNRDKVLALSRSKQKQAAFSTKRNPSGQGAARSVRVQVTTKRGVANQITLDDIGSFRKAWKVEVDSDLPRNVSENAFRDGIQSILGQLGRFKDWGGESNDLYSTRLNVAGKRRAAAFAFKGPGTKGALTPGKLGKNGDQIQRLVESPAEVFIIQYWSQITQPVIKQLEQLALLRSMMTGRKIWYGIIDGQDSHRIYQAYRSNFPSGRRRRRKAAKNRGR